MQPGVLRYQHNRMQVIRKPTQTLQTQIEGITRLPEDETEEHLSSTIEPAACMQRHDGAKGRMEASERIPQRNIRSHWRSIWVPIKMPTLNIRLARAG